MFFKANTLSEEHAKKLKDAAEALRDANHSHRAGVVFDLVVDEIKRDAPHLFHYDKHSLLQRKFYDQPAGAYMCSYPCVKPLGSRVYIFAKE